MVFDACMVAVGLALLILGGRALVSGASHLAGALGVSELTIGLTIVAFGTSAPELAVNTFAALRGDAAIAFGNVIGSNLANLALVLGLCALVRPLVLESVILSREIPMMLLATLVAAVLGLDRISGAEEVFDRADGIILLLLFSVFLYYSVSEVVGKRSADNLADLATERAHSIRFWPRWKAGGVALVGVGILVGGAELTVTYAVALAGALGVSDAVIGLTLVALGTSLPELTTSLVATWNGQTNLAVGNVVGSSVFNLLFILGMTAVIGPVPVPAVGGTADLAALILVSLLLLPLARASGSRLLRPHGLALFVGYVGYMAWRVSA